MIQVIVKLIFYWEMLTGAPGALVKDMKKEII
jgi:hypothetical protein